MTVTDVRGRGLRTTADGDSIAALPYDRFLAMSMIDVIADDDLVA